jgi:hypothetical protein
MLGAFGASKHLRCGRHSIARSRRPCVTWGRASGDPTRQIFRDVYPQESQRAFSIAPISLFRQRQSCRRGSDFAVLQSAGVQLSGYMAWLVWAFIHIQFLAEASLRFSVFLQWTWTYISCKRAERLIIRTTNQRVSLPGRQPFPNLLSLNPSL